MAIQMSNVPEELIMAAGCRPLLMTGSPESDTGDPRKHMEYPISLPVRYLYEAILTGKYDFVDLICIVSGDKWLENMYGCLNEEQRLNHSLKFGETYLLRRLSTHSNTTAITTVIDLLTSKNTWRNTPERILITMLCLKRLK